MNYRELFERLAECQLPAGVEIDFDGISPEYWESPTFCRSALMLIVDAMRKEGWAFEFADPLPDGGNYNVRAFRGEQIVSRHSDDEVTAIAECLIAALGVKE